MPTNPNSKDVAAERLKTNEKKWSPAVMEAGWTVIPSILLEHQHALGLDAMDINILAHLAMYWWTPDNKPHPSKGRIAQALNVDPRTVQRRIARLEKAGLIRREQRRVEGKGNDTNLYHFDGLVKELQPFAKQKIEEKAEHKARKEARLKRKGRPKLKVVK